MTNEPIMNQLWADNESTHLFNNKAKLKIILYTVYRVIVEVTHDFLPCYVRRWPRLFLGFSAISRFSLRFPGPVLSPISVPLLGSSMISFEGFPLLGTRRPLSTWGSPGGLLSIPWALDVVVFVSKGRTYQHILKYIMTIFLCDLIPNKC